MLLYVTNIRKRKPPTNPFKAQGLVNINKAKSNFFLSCINWNKFTRLVYQL